MDLTIEPYDCADALAPADLTAAAAVFNGAWADWVAGERPMSEAAYADLDRLVHPPNVQHRFLARDERGRLVGLGSLSWREPEPEPGAGIAHVLVDPAARRDGVGSALFVHLAEAARAARRIGMTIETPVDGPADGRCARAGLRADLLIVLNRADTRVAKYGMLAGWITAGEAVPGYSLIAYDGRCPDDLVAAFVAARHVMNDAPATRASPPRSSRSTRSGRRRSPTLWRATTGGRWACATTPAGRSSA